ncbi:MAG: BACON domain-containing protein [Clostridium sp.]|nr:BACON domain-containing protein [Bacteroides sp.]MCM1198908.1 BACON domain-containing protein [Clostridium sp.]
MKNNIRLFLMAVLAAVSCVKGPDMPMQSLAVDKDVLVVPSMGADYVVNVSTNTSWKTKCSSVDWAVASVEEAVGTSDMVVTVAANTGDERCGSIYVMSADNEVSREIKLVQAAVKSEWVISISSLRKMEKPGEPVVLDAPGTMARGFVVTDAEKGNWFSGQLAIEDSFTGPGSGINVLADVADEDFARGEEMAVELDKATLERNDAGFLTIIPAVPPVKTESTQLNVKPLAIGYQELASGEYESMAVYAEDWQVIEESIGGEYGQSPLFENKDGHRIRLSVLENASFAHGSYLEGVGSIEGIAGPASVEPELYPASLSGIALSEMRIGVQPGIRKLPYVFSFYHKEQTNNTPKYISFTKLTYNAATQLLSGTFATDLDKTTGAYMEVTAYGSEASKVYGPNLWAEAGAHDNFNTSGFVSLDCKTTPTAECGFMLNVPLQLDMPQDFNVSFGLSANNKYVLSNWMVSYSADRLNWYKAGDVVIDKPKTGGSFYLYFTVPVHLEVPMSAGSTLHIKLTPQGSDGPDGYKGADGHGSSCYVCLHSAIVISAESEGNTEVPAGAIYFEPFDKLTAGLDYFIGDRLGGFANYCAGAIGTWTEEKKNGLSGSYVMERPGYAQIGYVNTERASSRSVYVNRTGSLLTPALGKGGDLNLSFKACTYRTPAIRGKAVTTTPDVGSPDITSVVVEIVGEGTVEGQTSVTVNGLPVSEFKTFSLKITGATANTQIRFTSAPGDSQFSRWFIDDILVTE